MMTSGLPPSKVENGLRRYDISEVIEIILTPACIERPPPLQRRIDAVWEDALSEDKGLLFDGTILSVTDIGQESITVCEDKYRAYYAQSRDRAVFDDYPVRPLACSGLVTCNDGVVFAKRGDAMFLDPGTWELAPSGTFDRDAIGAGGAVDAGRFLQRELNEELGIEPSLAKVGPILGLYEHLDWKGIDLAIAVTVDLSRAQVEDIFSSNENDEYSAIAVIEPKDIATFVAQSADPFLPLSKCLLERMGYL